MATLADSISGFDVYVFYVPDKWATSPDGGRATTRGLYRAEVRGARACEGFGGTVEEAVDHLASELVAFVEADGYPYTALPDQYDLFETEVLHAAERGTLRAELLASAREPVLESNFGP